MKIYPAHFFAIMPSFLKHLIAACVFLPFAVSIDAAPPAGFLEGQLKIVSLKEVELADKTPSKKTAENYAAYPLIILSRDGKQEITRVTADENGNYRTALPPGDYIFDVHGRMPKGHVRGTPQPFTVTSGQTTHLDMNIDTGIR